MGASLLSSRHGIRWDEGLAPNVRGFFGDELAVPWSFPLLATQTFSGSSQQYARKPTSALHTFKVWSSFACGAAKRSIGARCVASPEAPKVALGRPILQPLLHSGGKRLRHVR